MRRDGEDRAPAPRPAEALAQPAALSLPGHPDASRGRWKHPSLLVLLALLLLLVVLVDNAWICDDAYITFRTVENFVSGQGLRWNLDERVQTYTHPLWMLTLSAARALTGEIYVTSNALSIGLTLAAASLLALRLAADAATALAGVMLLAGSKAFVDYGVSGLENPLTYVLIVSLVLAVVEAEREQWRTRAVVRVALLVALLGATRLDLTLLVAPLLALVAWRGARGDGDATARTEGAREPGARIRAGTRTLKSLVIGMIPLVLWEAFSLFYYGVPFPNTAYAKLANSIGTSELARQGVAYYVNSLRMDPLTLIVIATGVCVALFSGTARLRAAAAGATLYGIYIVRIGADFMSGRFFTAPFLLLVAAVVAEPGLLAGRRARVVALAGLGAGLLLPSGPIRSGRDYGLDRDVPSMIDAYGIADERAFYYFASGLLRARENGGVDHMWRDRGLAARARSLELGHRLVVLAPDAGMGYYGYSAGPLVHIVDPAAITDPLLARIPRIEVDPELAVAFPHMVGRTWRIGHLRRRIPEGYRESLETGTNQIRDPALHALWDDLVLVARAPLLDPRRVGAIRRLNLP